MGNLGEQEPSHCGSRVPVTRDGSTSKPILHLLLVGCSLLLLGSSVYRAATLVFGHDESVSFAIITSKRFIHTANHHVLNTVLMRWSAALFGTGEFALRLPNVVAHAVYLAATVAIAKRFRGPLLQTMAFVLLNCNLFLAEYFFSARGYGLATAGELVSLFLLLRAWDATGRERTRDVYLAMLAGSLAVLSNFAYLNFYLPLVLGCGWMLVADVPREVHVGRRLARALPLLALSALFLAYVVRKLLKLRDDGQLYFGGETGFVSDTIGSLVRCSWSGGAPSDAVVASAAGVVVGLFVLLFILGAIQLTGRGRPSPLSALVLLLAAAVAIPLAEHYLIGTLFPIERAALYYLPLAALVLAFGLHWVYQAGTRRWSRRLSTAVVVLVTAAAAWQFGQGFGLRSSCAWVADRHNREVVTLIDRDRRNHVSGGSVTLRAHWSMEPSLNYYRITRRLNWLDRVTRRPPPLAQTDYVYSYEADLRGVVTERDTRLASYPDLGTALVRINHASRD
jgi:hypothetical protein